MKFRIRKVREETAEGSTENYVVENVENYVGKRIKQNLKNINFNDDSDDDMEWHEGLERDDVDLRMPNINPLSRKTLPRRQVAPLLLLDDESGED